jgi:hypothetical protein
MRGTAIPVKNEIEITNRKLPSGRAIVGEFGGIQHINIYAPSVRARRTEREYFFNLDLPILFLAISHHAILR